MKLFEESLSEILEIITIDRFRNRILYSYVQAVIYT